MKKIILKILSKLCFAFVSIYGLNLILSGVNIFIPINIITIVLVTLLGSPGILGLVTVYFLI